MNATVCPFWVLVDVAFTAHCSLSQSRDGKSPLHMTAVHGRFTRSQTLIQNGESFWAVTSAPGGVMINLKNIKMDEMAVICLHDNTEYV